MEDLFWKRYTLEELEAKIRDEPITPESLRRLTSSSRIEVSIIDFENPKSKGVTMYCGNNAHIPRYHVVLNRLCPYEEQIETFAHELVHIHFRCGATYTDVKNGQLVEDIIERISVSVIAKYRILIEEILEDCPKV